LGGGLTSLGKEAFADCGFLSEVVFRGKAPYIASDAFRGVMATCYFPSSVTSWNENARGQYGGNLIWSTMTHTHSFTETITDPTCEKAGSKTQLCFCGESASQTIPALGHNWLEATTEKPETCERCGLTRGEPLDPEPDPGNTDGDGDTTGDGDSTGDGDLNYKDAMLVLRASVGLEVLSEEQIKRYDMDANGKLDYKDAMQILRKSVGL
jgi:hypothetical protein